MFGEPHLGKVVLPPRGGRVQRPKEPDRFRSAGSGDQFAEALA
jgi:hypothetical protein